MRFIIFILRTALALVFLAYGINYFYHLTFVPIIPIDKKKELPLLEMLTKTGYFFELVYGTQIACGFFLLIDRFSPLFTIIAFPVTLNIFLFHYFIDPNNENNLYIYGAILFVNLLLLLRYRKAYRPLFYSRAKFVDVETEILNISDEDEEPEERPVPPEFRI